DRIGAHFFYGWVVLVVAGAGIFASGAGQSHIFSVFIGPISRDLDIGAAAIASAYGLATLIAAFGLPLMGRIVDRQGARKTMTIVVILLGFACIAFGFAPGLIWLGLGFGALRFLAQGSLMLNSTNVLSHWFSRQRGFAMGLMLLGFAISMAIHPPASQWLIDHVGWRQAWIWIGVSTWVLMLPLLVFLLHNAPEPLGLTPDGIAEVASTGGVQDRHSASYGLTLAETLRTATFYIVATGLFTMSMLVTALHFFQVSIFEHQGLSPTIAAWMFPLSAVVAVFTQPFVGRCLDRFATPRVFATALLMLCASLITITFVKDLPTALLYGVVFGVNNAFNITMFGYLYPRYFGRRHLGSIQGVGQMIGVVGASVGPIPLGIAFDLFDDYGTMLLILAVIPIVVAVITQFLKEPDMPVRAVET
ncbi:MAG: MFS transporter, partial [Proteobacteria bacterium]|nr:MFS transporter [Pseudomonadota bacterium]